MTLQRKVYESTQFHGGRGEKKGGGEREIQWGGELGGVGEGEPGRGERREAVNEAGAPRRNRDTRRQRQSGREVHTDTHKGSEMGGDGEMARQSLGPGKDLRRAFRS